MRLGSVSHECESGSALLLIVDEETDHAVEFHGYFIWDIYERSARVDSLYVKPRFSLDASVF